MGKIKTEVEQRPKTELQRQPELAPEIVEKLIGTGNLIDLTAEQRVMYYKYMCQQNGLDPSARPFDFITFADKKGRERVELYARKGCAEQLRKIYGISIIDTKVEQFDGMYVVTCTAQAADERTETDIGAVIIGDDRPDIALMKAVTKAKRRLVLAMCGLGEVEEAHPSEWAERELPEPKSRILLEDEATAKNRFAEACKLKTTETLTKESLQHLLVQVQKITGSKSITACAEWAANNPVTIVITNGIAKFKEGQNGIPNEGANGRTVPQSQEGNRQTA